MCLELSGWMPAHTAHRWLVWLPPYMAVWPAWRGYVGRASVVCFCLNLFIAIMFQSFLPTPNRLRWREQRCVTPCSKCSLPSRRLC